MLAIAINTVRRGVRMKLVIAFVLFLMVMLILVPFALKSATQTGRVQITLTYSLSVLNIILSILTIFLSTSALCTEIRDKVIFTIDTKPVSRWEILVGKWLGVMMLDLILLVCAGGAIYGLVKHFSVKVEDKREMTTQVLTARVEARPEIVEDKRGAYVVTPHHEQEWEFKGVKTVDEIIHIKFKNFTSGGKDAEISGLWTVGDMEQGFYRYVTSFPGGAFREFRVPASVVSPQGTLKVRFMSISQNQISAIFPRDDVMVLYRAGGFGGNFFRAMLLILLRVAFIAVVGLASSTFLTFPVATLLSIFVFVMSLSLPFVDALLKQNVPFREMGLNSDQSEFGVVLAKKVLSTVLKVFPDLRAYDPVPYLIGGLLIGWPMVLKGFAGILLLRCGIIGFIACVIFNRRELANMGYR